MNCKVDGCERSARYQAAQLCQKHYFRQWRYGTTDTIRRGIRKRHLGSDGYIRVRDPDHPMASKKNGMLFEHRRVAYDAREGRIDLCERCKLIPITWETCHVDHDDGVRSNNEPGNLLVTCIGCNVMRSGRNGGGVMLTHDGETKNQLQWSRDPRVSVSNSTIRRRKQAGATDEEALFGRKVTHKNSMPQRRALKFVDGKRISA